MMIETGHYALSLAVMAALMQALLPIFVGQKWLHPPAQAAFTDWDFLRALSTPLAILQFALVLWAFLALMTAFIFSDFSVLLVAQHSHSLKPLLYKITGLWGNHEGSMLLWLLVMVLFGMLLALFGARRDENLRFYALGVQGFSVFLFGMFILLTSNGFLRTLPVPNEGQGLNPILQDPGLAFHPPTLYIGYVGLSLVFSLAVAGLLNRKIDSYWARQTKIFAMLAWLFLTAGIALGSFWAYYELGWGGFWFWDPVENSSLMPWLLTTALIHSLSVTQKLGALKKWTVFLSMMSFGLSLIGTFLVRSGIITSVHSFANDPKRGLFILAIIAVMLLAGFVLYGKRQKVMRDEKQFSLLTREGFLIFNNVFLLAMAGTVFLGTFYPLLVEMATGARISVGTPFYNATFTPLMAISLVLIGIVPSLHWQTASVKLLKKRLIKIVPILLGFAIAVLWLNHLWQIPAILASLIAGFVLVSACYDLSVRARLSAKTLGVWSMNIAHIGLALLALGVSLTSLTNSEKTILVEIGDKFTLEQYQFTIEGFERTQIANYQRLIVKITAENKQGKQFILTPEKRFFPAHNQETTEAAIHQFLSHDLYLSLGDLSADNKIVVRAYIRPMMNLIWFGSLLMLIAGLLFLIRQKQKTKS